MPGTFRAWDIKEAELFAAQSAQIEPNVQRMDEIMESVFWGLGQDPGQFSNVQDTRLWVVKTDPFPGAPRLRIWYTFDDRQVTLLSIEPIEDEQ